MLIKVDVIAEKTIKEQLDKATKTGHGVIIPTFHILSGTMTDDKSDTFNIAHDGSTKLYFTFAKGKRRVNVDLTPVITKAYEMATEG